ncbi:comEA protein [Yimella lutea]|uniref:ComEA protein n=1 Tax=Yimella lutea TaxID=587872 RepID=A0A542EFP3_9MICO|nr:helix-hairpin-helix domain-containing protein [Yimella lutea]TQJ14138.1 comEA protein [Yimella lutea]
MSRNQPPDRLAAILAELDEGRRTPWLPDEDDLIDRRPLWPALPGRRRRAAATHIPDRRGPGTDGDLDDFDTSGMEGETVEDEPRSRADRRHQGVGGGNRRDSERVSPHTPLFRTPLPDTEVDTHPGRAALIGALVVLLVAGVVFGVRVFSARSAAEPVPLAPAASTAVTSTGSATATAPGGRGGQAPYATSAAAASPTSLLVHVVGQVQRPGVVRLTSGSRVEDAIRAAGGAGRSADLSAVNLARLVTDGEQVQVPRPGESPMPAPAPAAQSGEGTVSTKAGVPAGPIPLNTATVADLDALPGVGPVLAARIIEWRTTNGRFSSVDELGEVSGIGDKLLERLRPLVTV